MSVPKSKRGQSSMEFYHNALTLRHEITTLLLRDFGLKKKLDANAIPYADILNSYKSWRGSVKIYGNYYRLIKIDNYFNKLFQKKEIF